jgi:hypothetical protein
VHTGDALAEQQTATTVADMRVRARDLGASERRAEMLGALGRRELLMLHQMKEQGLRSAVEDAIDEVADEASDDLRL